MAKYDYDIGIIGGGAAGLTVAAGAAQLGVKTILIEKDSKLGGDCLHYGCVPSKALIKSASVYQKMRTAEHYGLPPVDLPPVDLGKVNDRIQGIIDKIQVHDSEERFCQLGAKVVFGDASFVDDHQVEYDGKRVSAKYWVLATGSEPVELPIPGLAEAGYWTNMDIFSLRDLPKSMIVIGGGPIGCELAQAFSRLGTDVRILQRNCQILAADDQDMAEMVQDAFRREGIGLDLCAETQEVRKTAAGVELTYEAHGETHTISADKILVAVGRQPSISTLQLENAGVEYDARGVKVDDRLRTSQKHIFAAGDVIGKYQFTHAAGYEGGIVISNAVFKLPRKVDYTWMPWCTYTEPELASLGLNEMAATDAGIEYTVWEESFSVNDRAQAEGYPEGKIKLLLDKKGKPLGVQMVGVHAGELAAEWVAVLNSKTNLTTVASAMHAYPTVSEINKRVAGKVLSSKLFSDKVRKTLSFIFDYKGRACTLD
ncbi:tRNA uridine 5-carboxymethylaminomethyl modification enzyme GidA [Pseudodesulfovibrio profundus]|uniref:tRNA uridine 5-carboxymethylaminomethyl modification enzyme GidA n=1 Tax=Pseudodesulfovibrio profundus TaxID=57320 RepID=A0A2C8F3T1_9BACT|nr:FAD-dependent oxidoreductase [Pseudodesulfovibrio profundus]SOB57148.1 tRNA uridine 5-carboxymethylaminomethyl modification enzyme GidA [Pseudodesulfovibrio profundus]